MRFPGNLYEHQKAAVRKMIETGGRTALLLEPGLGKSQAMIRYLDWFAVQRKRAGNSKPVRVLIVAPLSATDTWLDQPRKWSSPDVSWLVGLLSGSILDRAQSLALAGGQPFSERRSGKWGRVRKTIRVRDSWERPDDGQDGTQGRVEVYVTNYETFGQRRKVAGSSTAVNVVVAEAVEKFSPDVLVLDESHTIKGAASNTSKALALISKTIPQRFLLTGTLAPHSPLDVFGQWRVMAPEAFPEWMRGSRFPLDWTKFSQRYAEFGGFQGKQVTGFRNLDELRSIMAKNSIVARKRDCLDLPPTQDVLVPFSLAEGQEERAYREMETSLVATLDDGATVIAPTQLARLTRLRALASGLIGAGNETRRSGNSRARVIASLCADTLGEEDRLCVFSEFRGEMDDIATELRKERGTEVVMIHGDVPSAERMEIRRKFGDRQRFPQRIILVAQVRTVSTSINELVTARHLIYGSMTIRRADYVQSRDRLDRIGQEREVTYWITQARGTVDEVIYAAHEQRKDVEKALLDHLRQRRLDTARKSD